MSQLDVSISFTNMLVTLFFLVMFLFYIYLCLVFYWYNKNLRVKRISLELKTVEDSNLILTTRQILDK